MPDSSPDFLLSTLMREISDDSEMLSYKSLSFLQSSIKITGIPIARTSTRIKKSISEDT